MKAKSEILKKNHSEDKPPLSVYILMFIYILGAIVTGINIFVSFFIMPPFIPLTIFIPFFTHGLSCIFKKTPTSYKKQKNFFIWFTFSSFIIFPIELTITICYIIGIVYKSPVNENFNTLAPYYYFTLFVFCLVYGVCLVLRSTKKYYNI